VLQAGALTGIAPQPLFRIALSLSIEDLWPDLLTGSSLRFGAVGGYGSSQTSVGRVERVLLAARAEGCPLRWGKRLSFSPCAAMELGITSASGEELEGDAGLWAMAGAGLRSTLLLTPELGLELQAEAELPLYRNDVYAGPEAVYAAEILAFQGGLGFSARLW
jgi:hypothetical protein